MLSEADVRGRLATAVRVSGLTQRAWAVGNGLDPGYLNHVLKGRRRIVGAAGDALLAALGLRRVAGFEAARAVDAGAGRR